MVYLSSVLSGCITNNIYEYACYKKALKESKDHLVFKKDLSQRNKVELKSLKGYYKCNRRINNAINLIPIYNVLKSLEIIDNQDEIYKDYLNVCNESVDVINRNEINDRLTYYEILKYIVENYNVNINKDISTLENAYVSYKDLLTVLKYAKIGFQEIIYEDKIVREIFKDDQVVTFTKRY